MSQPKVVPIGRAKPLASVVKGCEELLARAKAGELRSLTYVADTQTGALHGTMGQIDDQFRMLGQIERLKHRHLLDMERLVTDQDPIGEPFAPEDYDPA